MIILGQSCSTSSRKSRILKNCVYSATLKLPMTASRPTILRNLPRYRERTVRRSRTWFLNVPKPVEYTWGRGSSVALNCWRTKATSRRSTSSDPPMRMPPRRRSPKHTPLHQSRQHIKNCTSRKTWTTKCEVNFVTNACVSSDLRTSLISCHWAHWRQFTMRQWRSSSRCCIRNWILRTFTCWRRMWRTSGRMPSQYSRLRSITISVRYRALNVIFYNRSCYPLAVQTQYKTTRF